jgi:hypothetical protein
MLFNIPDGICDLLKLESLKLSENALTLLPQGIGRLSNLRCLTLHSNDITVLPDSIAYLGRLRPNLSKALHRPQYIAGKLNIQRVLAIARYGIFLRTYLVLGLGCSFSVYEAIHYAIDLRIANTLFFDKK